MIYQRLLLSIFGLLLITKIDAKQQLKVSSSVVGNKNQRQRIPFITKNDITTFPSRGGGKTSSVEESTNEGASIPSHIFNLVKGIVGVGCLSLPAGIAAFGDAKSALIPALALIALIGVLSGYGFALIGKVCAYTGTSSYRDAWSESVGEGSSWIPAWSCTIKTLGACLAFSMVLGDTFSALLGTERSPTLIALTIVCLLPLCLLKNLKSLAPFSLLGVIGMGYTAIAMTIRYLDGTYKLPNGKLVQNVAENLQPIFGNKGATSFLSPSSLILVCMLSTAYMAHFNAPRFYLELQNNTIPRFNKVVGLSFGISVIMMGFIAAMGFLTFGGNTSGLILNNYSNNDKWMSGSRFAVAVALIFSFPLAFTGCRDGFLNLLEIPEEKRSTTVLNMMTIILLSVVTSLALIVKDVSFLMTLVGATFGNALTYVFPALMYKSIVKKQNRTSEIVKVNISLGIALFGIIVGIIGAKMAIDNVKK